MKNKMFKRIATGVAAVAMAALSICPAFANNYTPIPGTSTTITKYLVMKDHAETPNAAFEFTIEAGTPVEATADTMKVWAGNTPDRVEINGTAHTGIVTFTAGQATQNSSAETVEKGITDATYTKYAQNTIVFDFSKVNFAEPGVYRYIVTETKGIPNHESITNDYIEKRTLDVYIEDKNDGSGTLKVAGYVFYEGVVTTAPQTDGTAAGTKTDRYVNKYTTYDLDIGKTVTGNQGSRDQYFQIKVSIKNAGDRTIMTIFDKTMETTTHANTATSYATSDMDKANQHDDDAVRTGKQLVADAQGNAEITVYLHHGQQFEIAGIPAGAEWEVTETDLAHGYTKIYDANQSGKFATNSDYHTDKDVNQTTIVTNDRQGIVPTGIIATLGLGVGIVGVAGAGLVIANKRKSDED